eukprot:m51a1_g4756 putative domain containing protein (707) ;mRNA; r:427378-429498
MEQQQQQQQEQQEQQGEEGKGGAEEGAAPERAAEEEEGAGGSPLAPLQQQEEEGARERHKSPAPLTELVVWANQKLAGVGAGGQLLVMGPAGQQQQPSPCASPSGRDAAAARTRATLRLILLLARSLTASLAPDTPDTPAIPAIPDKAAGTLGPAPPAPSSLSVPAPAPALQAEAAAAAAAEAAPEAPEAPRAPRAPESEGSAEELVQALYEVLARSTLSAVHAAAPQALAAGSEEAIAAILAFMRDRFDLGHAYRAALDQADADGPPAPEGDASAAAATAPAPLVVARKSTSQTQHGPHAAAAAAAQGAGGRRLLPLLTVHASCVQLKARATTELARRRAANAVRRRVALELLETEHNYVEGLRAMVRQLLHPIRSLEYAIGGLVGGSMHDGASDAGHALPTAREVEAVFNNVDEIADIHAVLMAHLGERTSPWSDSATLGDVLLDHAAGMYAPYRKYLAAYTGSLEMLKYLVAKYPAFAAQVRMFERSQQSGLTLASFLVLPVQRLPRYMLLAKELVRYTPADHSDALVLPRAIDSLTDVVTALNSFIDPSRGDAVRRLVALEASIDWSRCGPQPPQLVDIERRLVREGKLKYVERAGDRLTSRRPYCFLLSDALVVCKDRAACSSLLVAVPGVRRFVLVAWVALAAVAKFAVGGSKAVLHTRAGAGGAKVAWTLKADCDSEGWQRDLTLCISECQCDAALSPR